MLKSVQNKMLFEVRTVINVIFLVQYLPSWKTHTAIIIERLRDGWSLIQRTVTNWMSQFRTWRWRSFSQSQRRASTSTKNSWAYFCDAVLVTCRTSPLRMWTCTLPCLQFPASACWHTGCRKCWLSLCFFASALVLLTVTSHIQHIRGIRVYFYQTVKSKKSQVKFSLSPIIYLLNKNKGWTG